MSALRTALFAAIALLAIGGAARAAMPHHVRHPHRAVHLVSHRVAPHHHIRHLAAAHRVAPAAVANPA